MNSVDIKVNFRILPTVYLRIWVERMAVIFIQSVLKNDCHRPDKVVLLKRQWQSKGHLFIFIYWVRFYYYE